MFFSGRGTPNVSGRDTPSSQVEGEERDQRPLDLPVTAQKQNREDISDKFGKFEIKGLIEGKMKIIEAFVGISVNKYYTGHVDSREIILV